MVVTAREHAKWSSLLEMKSTRTRMEIANSWARRRKGQFTSHDVVDIVIEGADGWYKCTIANTKIGRGSENHGTEFQYKNRTWQQEFLLLVCGTEYSIQKLQ